MTSETERKKISRKVDRATNSPAKSDRARPTIGYLAVRIGDSTSQALWRGVTDAARELDVNLICFAGERLLFPDGTVSPANVLYDLVNSEVVDGLVTWASSVGGSLEYDETVAFHRRYHPLPIASITLPMEGCPTVLIDSYAGMRDMLAHLIEFHVYRRLAFIHGPETQIRVRRTAWKRSKAKSTAWPMIRRRLP